MSAMEAAMNRFAEFVVRHFGDEVANTIAAPSACRRFRRRYREVECARRHADIRRTGA